MKKIFLLLLTLLAVAPVSAQRGDTVFQTREVIIIDEREPVIVSREHEINIGGRDVMTRANVNVAGFSRHQNNRGWSYSILNQFGLGYSGLVQDFENFHLPKGGDWEDWEDIEPLPEGYEWMAQEHKSINVKILLASANYNFTRHLDVKMGLELEGNNYRFENDVTLTLDEHGHIAPDWRFADASLTLEKTKLYTSFLNVPLTLHWGIGRRNQFELYGGVVGGWRMASWTKLKADNRMLSGKEHHRDRYNLRNFHYGYTAGFSIQNVGLYATYYPHSIFRKGDVDIRSINVGLQFRFD